MITARDTVNRDTVNRDTVTRLPGVLCETRLPNLPQQPLRLDVPAFAGLAERGPLDVPVLIEDGSQYRLVFGGDLPVARVEGQPLFAHLPASVEAFFENGGRRCYVVRVAGAGRRANQFQLPGLLYEAAEGDWQPVVVPAAWPGRWSDLLSLATGLRLQPLQIRSDGGPLLIDGSSLNDSSFTLPLRLQTPAALRPGDLLRLRLQGAGGEQYQLYARAVSVEQAAPAGAIQFLGGIPVVVRTEAGRLFRAEPDAVTPAAVARMTPSGWVDLPFAAAAYVWSGPTAANKAYRLSMPLPGTGPAAAPIETGTLLRISGGGVGGPVFFVVERVQRGREGGGAEVRLLLDSANPLQVAPSAAAAAHELLQVDVLSFDLLLREGETTMESWLDLRFGKGPGGWRAMLQAAIDMKAIHPLYFTVDDFAHQSLRLGAAPDSAADPLILPLGVGTLPLFQGPRADPQRGSKDGLDGYDPVALFMDPAFVAVGTRNLLATANDLMYLAPEPRRLLAMHSLIPLDEVAMVAIPDLAHLGWQQFEQPQFTEPVVMPPPPTPPKGFHDCPQPPAPPVEDCVGVPVVDLAAAGATDSALLYSAAWGAQIAGGTIALAGLPEQLSPAEHDDESMREVQRAAIRLCAGRADMVALLNLPQHYDVQAASQWYDKLSATPDFFDGDPLSYAAVYHPWSAIREETAAALTPLRYLPPDGFAAGTIAARELQRGAWIAPANVSLRSVVDLRPAFGDGAWAKLYARRLNIIRQQPGRYVVLSAMTLAHDQSLRQLSVRRLLILLRKLALREGQRYVFETNNERFRSLVQTYFENILTRILERGGLRAFQVVTNAEINTPADYDNGRFLIALKVAPTLPIEYITITMLRSGDDSIAVLGG